MWEICNNVLFWDEQCYYSVQICICEGGYGFLFYLELVRMIRLFKQILILVVVFLGYCIRRLMRSYFQGRLGSEVVVVNIILQLFIWFIISFILQ